MSEYCKDACGTCEEEMEQLRAEEKIKHADLARPYLNEIVAWSGMPEVSGRLVGVYFGQDDDYYILRKTGDKDEHCSMVGGLTSFRSWEGYAELEKSYLMNGNPPVTDLIIRDYDIKDMGRFICPHCQKSFLYDPQSGYTKQHDK